MKQVLEKNKNNNLKHLANQNLIQKLKKSEKKYRALFENTGTAIFVTEEDTTITMVNREMEKLSGFKKEEVENKMCWTKFVAKEEKAKKMLRYHKERRRLQNNNQIPIKYEFIFKTKSGLEKFVIANIVLLSDSSQSIVSLVDISGQKKFEQKINYIAYHDNLTGLYNRDYFEKKIKEMDKGKYLSLSIIMGDVNSLKLVNDAFGHKKGDQLLKTIADIIKKACRNEDIIIRWGGDEFLIILPNTDYKKATKIREKIVDDCSIAKFDLIQPSIALGVATKTDINQDIQNIIKNAEKWVYKNKLVESNSVRSSILKTLEETLLLKNYETEEHARRAKVLSIKMGKALNLSNNEIDELILLAGLHDIGKIAISEEILLKPGSLTKKEWEIIKKHSEIGYRIANASPELASISKGILHHHEWWNGSGYPSGLEGEKIPLVSRIISIVDAYDVMTHKRPYKEALTIKCAIEELISCAGIQFDPNLVTIFINQVVEYKNLRM